MINFAMLRTVIGRILIVEKHAYRRARLRGRAMAACLDRIRIERTHTVGSINPVNPAYINKVEQKVHR